MKCSLRQILLKTTDILSIHFNDQPLQITNNPSHTKRKLCQKLSKVHFGRKVQEIWFKLLSFLKHHQSRWRKLVNFIELVIYILYKYVCVCVCIWMNTNIYINLSVFPNVARTKYTHIANIYYCCKVSCLSWVVYSYVLVLCKDKDF